MQCNVLFHMKLCTFRYCSTVLIQYSGFITVYAKEADSSEEETIEEVSKMIKEKFNITIIDDLMKLKEKVESKCPDLESKLDVSRIEVYNIKLHRCPTPQSTPGFVSRPFKRALTRFHRIKVKQVQWFSHAFLY